MDDLKLEGVVLTAAEAEVTSNADTHVARVDENNMEVSCGEAERPKTVDRYHEDPFIIFIFYVPHPSALTRIPCGLVLWRMTIHFSIHPALQFWESRKPSDRGVIP